MKIALLAPLSYPIREPFHGGLEMHTHLLARELMASGHEVTLFAHPDSDKRFNLVPVALPAGPAFGKLAGAYRRAIGLIAKGGFGVVHDNSIHFLPSLLALQVPCPMVTTLHTPPYRSLRWAGRLARRNPRHRFVSISHHLQEVWAPWVGKHAVIHNGLDLSGWPFQHKAVPRTAVWYGRFTPEKGAEFAIAAARAAGYQLTLAGPVYDQVYFDTLIAPELDEAIRYAGHLTQHQLAGLVGNSAIGIVTSVWDEPFGLVYAEMLACGTPVAGFRSGAAAEIVTPEVGILVAKKDIGALTQVLAEVEKSKARPDCRARVEQAFQVAGMVNSYLDLYTSLR